METIGATINTEWRMNPATGDLEVWANRDTAAPVRIQVPAAEAINLARGILRVAEG